MYLELNVARIARYELTRILFWFPSIWLDLVLIHFYVTQIKSESLAQMSLVPVNSYFLVVSFQDLLVVSFEFWAFNYNTSFRELVRWLQGVLITLNQLLRKVTVLMRMLPELDKERMWFVTFTEEPSLWAM